MEIALWVVTSLILHSDGVSQFWQHGTCTEIWYAQGTKYSLQHPKMQPVKPLLPVAAGHGQS